MIPRNKRRFPKANMDYIPKNKIEPGQRAIQAGIKQHWDSLYPNTPHCTICGDLDELMHIRGTDNLYCKDCIRIQSKM